MDNTHETTEQIHRLSQLLNLEAHDILYLAKMESTLLQFAERESGDEEAYTIIKISVFCKNKGLYAYHQADPRGCQLWVSRKYVLTHENYTLGVPVHL